MEQNTPKFRLRLNLFDGIVLVAALAVAAVLLWMNFKPAAPAAGDTAPAVVQMLGFRSDVTALLNVLDVQLNASYGTEATSMALLEGMSLGLPSVVSDYGGNPWVIDHGDTGLIFPSRNAAALAEAMARLTDSPEERRAMGCRAKEVFRSRFTGPIFARNTEDVYRNILKGAK